MRGAVVVDGRLGHLVAPLSEALPEFSVGTALESGGAAFATVLVPPDLEAIRRLRSCSHTQILVIAVSGRDVADVVDCLETGADSHSAPSVLEIAARVRALERRR